MAREAYSAGGQVQQADDGAAAQLDLHSSTANLTQELSLLLAQSIAQGQGGKRVATTTAGSELANLAALVSASQNQRGQPTYKDGLSALSYARPAQPPPPPPPPAGMSGIPSAISVAMPGSVPVGSQGGGLLVPDAHDEEPMPIPSTWRQPASGEEERWYRQQLGAAALGLVAGLIVVVPAVLWLSGWIGGPSTKAVAARHQPTAEAAPFQVAEVKPVKVHVAASAEPRIKVGPAPAAAAPAPVVAAPAPVAEPPPRVEPVRSRADELIAQARRLIENGDISGARLVLQAGEMATSGSMTFMLAETYDPNMLASWQTRGIAANPERARALYQRARDLGETRAQQRLDWLMAN